MKCSKCGSEVKPNYKFCTKCGQPMSNDSTTTAAAAHKKSEPMAEKHSPASEPSVNEKFLGLNFGRRRNKPEQSNQTAERAPRTSRNVAEEVDLVRGKAIWNIGPGQIARRISELEFAQIDEIKGIVIQQGVTAVVNVDGQFMGMLEGGYYEFASKTVRETARVKVEKEEADELADEGILEKAGKVARRVWRFFTGSSKNEKKEQRRRRTERIRQQIRRITSKSVVNVTLVNTRVFEMLLGSVVDAQGVPEFQPMKIKTLLMDLDMGVSLQMQVSDVNSLLVNYLSDRDSLSVTDIQRMIQPSVENLLGRMLRNFDYQAAGLPEDFVDVIKKQIAATIQERVYGLEVVRILDVTDQSSDFDRFRAVEHELFASEQELGFLRRTGEFRNRLALETNAQEIQNARNEEDLRHALNGINRDQLLHDDEMEAFVELLSCQKRLREAKNEEQVYEALQDLRKCRLVKDDDVAALENMLLHKEIEREEATDLLRLRVYQNTEEARMRAENALSDMALGHQLVQESRLQQHQIDSEIAEARHRVDMTEYDIQARRKSDDYQREQHSMDYDFFQRRRTDELSLAERQAEFERNLARQNKLDDMDILERKAKIAQQNLETMLSHELQDKEGERRNEALRIQTEATMTQEQIAAAHMKDIAGLDAAAQAEMARMMKSDTDKVRAEELQKQQEMQREMYDRMLEMQRQNQASQGEQSSMSQQQMMQMMQSMMATMAQMGQQATAGQQAQFAREQAFQQQRYQDMTQMKDEYRENAMLQQQRMDHTQDSALNYTTRPAVKEASEVQLVWCGACGSRYPANLAACPRCNEPNTND